MNSDPDEKEQRKPFCLESALRADTKQHKPASQLSRILIRVESEEWVIESLKGLYGITTESCRCMKGQSNKNLNESICCCFTYTAHLINMKYCTTF